MKITLVEPQKKSLQQVQGVNKRYNIFLDGKFSFGADEDTVIKWRLVPGKEIKEEDLDAILLETKVGQLMGRMYNLFSVRARSEKEVRDYIRNLNFKRKINEQEEIPELIIESLIENLKNKQLINDLVFAKSWVESRRRSKQKGVNFLKMELIQKGVSREIIEEVLRDKGTEGQSEEELAMQALEKKANIWRNCPVMEFKKKATEFLMRRGFDYSVAKEVVSGYLLGKSEEENSRA